VGKRKIGLWLGPALAAALVVFPDLEPRVKNMAAVAVLMAVWWITEAIPIPATALLPVALFPTLGIAAGKSTASHYFNSIIFLFLGGFLFAIAMEKWRLHERVATRIIRILGTSPRRLLLGFMIATWLLSMWISNTATAMMLVPMATAILARLSAQYGDERAGLYGKRLLLGIAYAASIGGTATLIGTPPNLSLARILTITFPDAPAISFASWIVFALPFATVFLLVAWWLLAPRWDVGAQADLKLPGPMSREEKWVAALFVLLVLGWTLRRFWAQLLPEPKFVDDGTVAILLALPLFIIPAHGGGRLLDWNDAARVRWGIVLLFGGGFALASGFTESGLSAWLGDALKVFGSLPPIVLVLIVCTTITFLTELTSNTATTEMILPVLAALAVATDVHPLLLMIPATLSASCAFMLPVATPPNAIVFGSGQVEMSDMVRQGLRLNLIGVVLITLWIYVAGSWIGIESGLPAWAAK